MTYVILPEQQELPPITYDFAVEAYVARHFRDDDYFFIWQTKPTVILGRNQLLQNEVNRRVHLTPQKRWRLCLLR